MVLGVYGVGNDDESYHAYPRETIYVISIKHASHITQSRSSCLANARQAHEKMIYSVYKTRGNCITVIDNRIYI